MDASQDNGHHNEKRESNLSLVASPTEQQQAVVKAHCDDTPVSTQPKCFLSLPLELRRMIYKFALEGHFHYPKVRGHWSDRDPQKIKALAPGYPAVAPLLGDLPDLLKVSKQFYEEAGLVYISNSTISIPPFRFPESNRFHQFLAWLGRFPDNTGLTAVRSVQILCYKSNDVGLWDDHIPPNPISSIFPGLSMLELEFRGETFFRPAAAIAKYGELTVKGWLEHNGENWDEILKCKKLKKLVIVEGHQYIPNRGEIIDRLNELAEWTRVKFEAQKQTVEVTVKVDIDESSEKLLELRNELQMLRAAFGRMVGGVEGTLNRIYGQPHGN